MPNLDPEVAKDLLAAKLAASQLRVTDTQRAVVVPLNVPESDGRMDRSCQADFEANWNAFIGGLKIVGKNSRFGWAVIDYSDGFRISGNGNGFYKNFSFHPDKVHTNILVGRVFVGVKV